MSTIIPGLLGGLALFLYAMNAMTKALEEAAGDRLRQVLAAVTGTPLAGALAGAAVTAAVQSSSAATVMVVGFVGAGLMGLPQAVAVIFGANVGTTVTAQLLAFSLDELIYPMLFGGFLAQALARGSRGRAAAQAVFFFALLLEGVRIMGRAGSLLADSPRFNALLAQTAERPVLGLILGASMTVIAQSSSAAVAILQRLAAAPGPDGVTGLIGLAGAIPLLLGSNIGTTVTAIIAAAGQSRDARRAALAHCIFNLSGSAVFLCFIPAFARLVTAISPAGSSAAVIARQIANAHTLFNLLCTAAWLPLTRVMVRLVTWAVPDR